MAGSSARGRSTTKKATCPAGARTRTGGSRSNDSAIRRVRVGRAVDVAHAGRLRPLRHLPERVDGVLGVALHEPATGADPSLDGSGLEADTRIGVGHGLDHHHVAVLGISLPNGIDDVELPALALRTLLR